MSFEAYKKTDDTKQASFDFSVENKQENEYTITRINYEDTKDLILNVHYAKRMPSISYAYGLFKNKELVGLVSYGAPASPRVCEGICGKEHSKKVLELNRLVLRNNKKNEASMLVGKSLKLLPKPSIVISYADTSQDHVGYIYQATNFIYLGLSAKRTDRVFIDGTKQKHGRHVISTDVENIKERTVLVARPRKHRYLQILASKTEKKALVKLIKYKTEPYPKKILNNKLESKDGKIS
tara:strand:+ start:586 stop:1299 length:714 start_codon:yes stop_codon:yes gene_type:complete